MKIKLVRGQLLGVYSEQVVNLLRSVGLDLEFTRLSVIEPTDNGDGFQIMWRNKLIIEKLGEAVTLDNGKPFSSYEQAVKRELELVDATIMC